MGAVCRDSGTNGEGVVAAAILAAVRPASLCAVGSAPEASRVVTDLEARS